MSTLKRDESVGVNVVFPVLGFYCHQGFLINVEQDSEQWKGAYSHIMSHKSRTTQWLLACSAPWHSRPITSSGGRKELRQFPVCQRNAMPSACRFDWSQQKSHNHITQMNADRKLPKEQDRHSPILPLVVTTKLSLIYFIWCHLLVPPNHCLATLYQCVAAHRRAPFL